MESPKREALDCQWRGTASYSTEVQVISLQSAMISDGLPNQDTTVECLEAPFCRFGCLSVLEH
jgi:hypothetical protein